MPQRVYLRMTHQERLAWGAAELKNRRRDIAMIRSSEVLGKVFDARARAAGVSYREANLMVRRAERIVPLKEPTQFAGCYTLDLYCDMENEAHGHNEFPHQFTGETFWQCVVPARRRGWIIHISLRTATCPKCRGKRR